MSQYLLLRDNKQSGPYNFDELTAKGLKAYDLIWIEGKSAAWRYPSEIQELKPFAPVVEEQPYDRFYKRQDTAKKQDSFTNSSTSTNTTTPARNNVNTTARNTANQNNAIEPAQVKKVNPNTIPNRRVVVIMPGGINKEPIRESVSFHQTVENKVVQAETKAQTSESSSVQPESRVTSAKPQASSPRAITHQPDYDPQLVEFTKVPLANSGPRHNRHSAKSKLPKILAGTFIMLTVCGLLGWAYNYNFSEKQALTPVALPLETVQLPETNTVFNNEPSEAIENQLPITENELTDEEMLIAENQMAAVDSAGIDAAPADMIKKPVAKAKKAPGTINRTAEQTVKEPVTEIVQQTRAEIAVSNAANEEAEKKNARKNISELIRVSKNDFKIGAFGGISNLELKVTNTSPYPVDLVVVEVKYLLANKKEFKTENIYFKNLPPGSTATKEAPKSARGIEVTSKVALITSKALGMYQASL